ncbi:GvpL/GvpF family gas vesicle protein [Streptomyces sp. LP05-1]|uniref:GvpL/GvpF family gas vesicle protein n=1 Tax=Streptomyces pyxinae TaxID=2970734 RepID=A0ABT2CMH0_9ACTN|nr:GvpL/GvpF family gas vesicle protein [Streptomyces sp. LP05-1]MCS0638535.1 GvpL/GvpF family gas vesicle protein [Streptomyces sp. LP05-1]
MSVYVYGITSADHPLRLDGAAGVGDPARPLRVVRGAVLAAVVSDAPDGLRARRRDVLAHQAVLDRLTGQATALPLRFGSVAPDDEAVRQALDERADEYRERLAALDGCAEFHLRAAVDEDALLREVLRQSGEARRLNDEVRAGHGTQELRVALGELVAAEVGARQDSFAAGIVDTLRPLAREVRRSDPTGDDFLSASFLVESARREEFTAREAELAARYGTDFDFRLHGPLPPYSFV